MEAGFQTLKSHLREVEKRMDCLEEKLNSTPHNESLSSNNNPASIKQNRKNPPELQVCKTYFAF